MTIDGDYEQKTPGASISRRAFIGAVGVCAAAVAGQTSMPVFAAGCGGSAGCPQPKELFCLPASRLAEMIRTKRVSSEEVVRAHIERIEAVNPRINAVVYLAEGQALEHAKNADLAIAQGRVDWCRQPLFGVPVSFKDAFETGGVPTTAGAPALKDNIPKSDATVVRKMKEAGAILLAKTNMPFLGCAFDTVNLVHGQTNNPYDLTRVPGGSSGGEAALIAAGGSPLGVGTDGSGSIRVPSHFCGVAGLCPSWGRVSTAGVIPQLFQNNGPFFCAIGPMARCLRESCAAALHRTGCRLTCRWLAPRGATMSCYRSFLFLRESSAGGSRRRCEVHTGLHEGRISKDEEKCDANQTRR